MTIVGVEGKLRQGKGILLTNIALDIADSGAPVLSNYKMDSPNVTKIDFYDFVSILTKPRAKQRTLIVIDEIQGWLDSYIGQSKSGRFGSYAVFQSAKLGYDILYSTQLNMRAQNTLRELCDYRVIALKDHAEEVFYYAELDPFSPNDDVLTGGGFTITYKQASEWWNRYNTYEPVTPVGMTEVFMEMEKHDPRRVNKTVDFQVQLLISHGYTDKRRIAVKSNLLKLEQPTVFYDLCAHRLEEQLLSNSKTLKPMKSSAKEKKGEQEDNSQLLQSWQKALAEQTV